MVDIAMEAQIGTEVYRVSMRGMGPFKSYRHTDALIDRLAKRLKKEIRDGKVHRYVLREQ